jgi:hypothetical protein
LFNLDEKGVGIRSIQNQALLGPPGFFSHSRKQNRSYSNSKEVLKISLDYFARRLFCFVSPIRRFTFFLHFLTYSAAPCFFLFSRRVFNDEDQAFSPSYDLATLTPPPPCALPSASCLFLSLLVCRGQCCGAENITFGAGTADPQIRSVAQAPAPFIPSVPPFYTPSFHRHPSFLVSWPPITYWLFLIFLECFGSGLTESGSKSRHFALSGPGSRLFPNPDQSKVFL